jgi:signal transduction histidine kinase
MVRDTVKRLQLSAAAKGLHLTCDVHPEIPEMLRGDPLRLQQVLTNLIGNAIIFTSAGQVNVAIENAHSHAGELHFAVSDTGICIPPEKHSMIFEAFTQVDGSYTRKFGGTGLGLTIASRLVKMMGGHIWVESKGGEGSTFHFTASLALSAPSHS